MPGPVVDTTPGTRVAVHVLAVDPERRVLLDHVRQVHPQQWGMPQALVAVGEDPAVTARRLVVAAGAVPATRAEVIDLDSVVEDTGHVVHLIFECGAEPLRRRGEDSPALWWTIDEIVALALTARTRKALASRWSMIWPDT
jgi:ADP-ribose pyrophosphatase YjhB (NUDIX family)